MRVKVCYIVDFPICCALCVLHLCGSAWHGSQRCEKCGFPLAEERKKRKTFFSHAAGSLGTGVQGGFRSRGSCRFQFLFCHPPLPDMPHPPTHKVLVEGVS